MSRLFRSNLRLTTLLPAVLLLVSCSLFELRDSEEPDDTTSGLCVPVHTPADVIQNFRQAFNFLDVNCYFSCFVDSTWVQDYSFVPEAGYQDFPLFEGWTADSEQQFMNALSQYYTGDNEGREHLLELSNQVWEEGSDSATYYYDYDLTMFQEDTLHSYAGGILLKLSRQSTFQDWAVYYWEDQAVPDMDSWTALKVMMLQ